MKHNRIISTEFDQNIEVATVGCRPGLKFADIDEKNLVFRCETTKMGKSWVSMSDIQVYEIPPCIEGTDITKTKIYPLLPTNGFILFFVDIVVELVVIDYLDHYIPGNLK